MDGHYSCELIITEVILNRSRLTSTNLQTLKQFEIFTRMQFIKFAHLSRDCLEKYLYMVHIYILWIHIDHRC